MMDRQAFNKGLAWTVVVNLINKAIFPLISIVISRVLGPGPLGAYAILSTILMISEIFRDAGLTQTYLADRDMSDRKEGSYMGLAILMALIPAIFLVFARGWLAVTLDLAELPAAILVMFFALICNGVATIPRAKLLRGAKMRELALIDLVSGGSGLILTIILVFAGFAFWALVIQMLYCSLLTMGLSFWAAPVGSVVLQRTSLFETFKRTASLLAANALNNIFLMADVFVIRKLLGSDALLGLFGQGKNIAYKPADFVTFPLTRMLIVAFSQAAGEKARLCRAYARSVVATMLFVTPIYVLLILAAKPIIEILLGPKFSGSAPILSVMSVFLLFRTIGTIGGTALVSDGKARITLYAQIAGLAVTTALLLVNGPKLHAPTFSTVAEFRSVRTAEIGASASSLGPTATFAVAANKGESKTHAGQWVVFTMADQSKSAELLDLSEAPMRVMDRGVDAAAYVGPKELSEITGSNSVHYPNPPGMKVLQLIVWCFTLGAVVLYGMAVATAFYYYPAPAEERIKLIKATGLTVLVGAVIFGIGQLPFGDLARLGLTVLVVPCFHLVAIGVAFAGSPLAYLSPSGVRKLWNSL